MKLSELKAIIIPALNTYCGAPIIQADQVGDRPDDPHATFKFTTSYGKAVGRPDEVVVFQPNQYFNGQEEFDGDTDFEGGTHVLRKIQDYKTTISFTAYAMDDDNSVELAQMIYDWFDDDGVATMQNIGVAVVDQTDITNRDAFVVENYERRNGFDVILRVSRVKDREIDWIETAQIINQ